MLKVPVSVVTHLLHNVMSTVSESTNDLHSSQSIEGRELPGSSKK